MTDIYADDRGSEGSDRLRSLGAVEIPNPDRVTSVAVVPVDTVSGRVLGVMLRDRGLDIPGGHRQYEDIDLEATARREALEEASAELGELSLVDVVESEFYGSSQDQLTYMVIYGGAIAQLAPFTASADSSGRELVAPAEFLVRYRGGDVEMMSQWITQAVAQFAESR